MSVALPRIAVPKPWTIAEFGRDDHSALAADTHADDVAIEPHDGPVSAQQHGADVRRLADAGEELR